MYIPGNSYPNFGGVSMFPTISDTRVESRPGGGVVSGVTYPGPRGPKLYCVLRKTVVPNALLPRDSLRLSPALVESVTEVQ